MAISVPGSAYVYMFGIALFGGLFVWLMIFITHLSFRKHWVAQAAAPCRFACRSFPVTTILGGAAVLAIIISTWWVDGMRTTLESGIPWLLLLTLCYLIWARRQKTAA